MITLGSEPYSVGAQFPWKVRYILNFHLIKLTILRFHQGRVNKQNYLIINNQLSILYYIHIVICMHEDTCSISIFSE